MTPDLRDLDRAIAEARGETHFCPTYSTDPAWTLRLLEEMREDITMIRPWSSEWEVSWYDESADSPNDTETYGDTLPEAVARAWLAWHEITRSPAG